MIIINKIKDIRYITLSYVSTKYILSSEQMYSHQTVVMYGYREGTHNYRSNINVKYKKRRLICNLASLGIHP